MTRLPASRPWRNSVLELTRETSARLIHLLAETTDLINIASAIEPVVDTAGGVVRTQATNISQSAFSTHLQTRFNRILSRYEALDADIDCIMTHYSEGGKELYAAVQVAIEKLQEFEEKFHALQSLLLGIGMPVLGVGHT